MEADDQAIRELNATWIDAVNKRDLACLLALMADDVVFLGPGQAPFGRDKFHIGFTAAHQQSLIRCVSAVEEVVVVGDLAHTVCRDSVSATPHAGGDALEFAGYRLTVFRKQPDGRWLLARDAHTVAPVVK